MKILATTHLRIRDQGELLNQIAGTYKDFFRAAMEYVDNAVDAAAAADHAGSKTPSVLRLHVDTVTKRVSFTDNCGGMTPRDLAELLSEVGRSKKKAVPWANGQFGFGVHAFRAFAKEAVFVSKRTGGPEAKVKIDRSFDETREVAVEASSGKTLEKGGTAVMIGRFDSHVFKRSTFFRSLVSEIEHHFEDVLRSGLIRILVQEDRSREYECRPFDYESLPGVDLKRSLSVRGNSESNVLKVDLKVLEKAQENRLAILTNKGRRIQTISDLKSWKTFARNAGITSYVWSNPFVVGSVELNDSCSPNLTRDDLRDSAERDAVYELMVSVQEELQGIVDRSMNQKVQESFRRLADAMSDALSRILRGFRLSFQEMRPSGVGAGVEGSVEEGDGEYPFGGDAPGGGGEGRGLGEGDGGAEAGHGGPGEKPHGGGGGDLGKATHPEGQSTASLGTASGPRIDFQAHTGGDRVIDLGGSLIINTLHPDFIVRNASKSGDIKLDARLLAYVAVVVAPPCVHRLFERRGKVPTALEAGGNVVDLSMKLEQELVSTIVGMEVPKGRT